MRKKSVQRISLSRETLRSLEELTRVEGASANSCMRTDCPCTDGFGTCRQNPVFPPGF